VWEDKKACRAHLVARASPSHPVVSEAGRRFLAERLSRLRDAQLRDLFAAARIERLGETMLGSDGRARLVTVDDWVAAFKRKRQELVDQRCPE
jgi:hypothetical protein